VVERGGHLVTRRRENLRPQQPVPLPGIKPFRRLSLRPSDTMATASRAVTVTARNEIDPTARTGRQDSTSCKHGGRGYRDAKWRLREQNRNKEISSKEVGMKVEKEIKCRTEKGTDKEGNSTEQTQIDLNLRPSGAQQLSPFSHSCTVNQSSKEVTLEPPPPATWAREGSKHIKLA
jgi:hypothetical protein